MEISYTLIVALMYVTVLSFGLASLLTSLAQIIRRGNGISASPAHLNWLLILLLVHFNMVWHAVLFTNIEAWSYHAFLIIVLGPTLAFFSANILAPEPVANEDNDALNESYFSFIQQFLVLFGAIQLWAIASDFILGRGITGSAIFNILLFLIALFLFKSRSNKVHVASIYFIWAVYITSIALRSMGQIN